MCPKINYLFFKLNINETEAAIKNTYTLGE